MAQLLGHDHKPLLWTRFDSEQRAFPGPLFKSSSHFNFCYSLPSQPIKAENDLIDIGISMDMGEKVILDCMLQVC